MDPRWPATSALPPHLRPALGAARLRGHWPGDGLVRALGLREPMPRGLVRRSAGSGDLFLAYFHQGTLVRLGDGRRALPPGTLVAWRPGMVQEYGLADAAWLHSWLHLRAPLGEALTDAAGLACGVPIPLPDARLFEGPLHELHTELARSPPDQAVIEALAAILLRRLARQAPVAGDGLAEVRARILAEPLRRHRLADLAALAGCGPQHLCRAFRARYGVTPVACARHARLDRAAALLGQGLAPAQAAARCGWADARQFARIFAARYGCSPAARRRRTP